MEKTLELTDKLGDAIFKSDVYRVYIRSWERIKKDNQLLEKVNDFKKKHIEYKKRENNGENIPFGDEILMSRLYFDVIRNDDIRAYLESEEKLLSLINDVYIKLGDIFGKVLEEYNPK